MARSPRDRRPEPVDLRSTDVVLTGTDDMLGLLRAAASRAGVSAARMHVLATSEEPGDRPSPDAGLAVVLLRRPGDDPAFHRAQVAVERVRPLLATDAVHVVITVSGMTRLAPKLERRLTEEVLHQLGAAAAVSGFSRPFRSLRMRLGLGGLRAAGVRVFRIAIAP
jgi:hypothetical protein